MAVDQLVDSAQLDADLTSVANAIRTKGGTSESLTFPTGFVNAIGAISGGGGKVLSGVQYNSSESFSFYISIGDEDPTPYRYLAVCISTLAMAKPGYKAFFFAFVDFKIGRVFFGYTNNSGTADVGNCYGDVITNNACKVIKSTGTLSNAFGLMNTAGSVTGSTFGYFSPGNYTWVAWGDIDE